MDTLLNIPATERDAYGNDVPAMLDAIRKLKDAIREAEYKLQCHESTLVRMLAERNEFHLLKVNYPRTVRELQRQRRERRD